MRYSQVEKAIFLSRPNRFIANVLIDGREEVVHVKNTGRCRELLVPGCTVYLSRAQAPGRKTLFDLIAVEKRRPGQEPLLVNMDSQAPNTLCREWLEAGGLGFIPDRIHCEVTFENSRFDLMLESADTTAFVEVKGVTLEDEGLCMFPDAPTLRGTKHLNELVRAVEQGYQAYLVFVVQMQECHGFVPHTRQDPAFAAALIRARQCGVTVLAVSCRVAPDELYIEKKLSLLF